MNPPLMPVVFQPILVEKPWGGRRLEELFGKKLPPAARIGESWELAGLPSAQSCVAAGPLAGLSIADLTEAWGEALLGKARQQHGRFPVLIKFLDISDALSVQVHPRPTLPDGSANPDAKDEAWFIVGARAEARLYLGVRAGVDTRALAAAGPTSALLDRLLAWPAERDRCYFLPSGTPHACGGGLVALEVQTPADVTYRMYDWDRLGPDGRPRAIHFEQALEHVRLDVTPEAICPGGATAAGVGGGGWTRPLIDCAAFSMTLCRGSGRLEGPSCSGKLRVWVGLRGTAELRCPDGELPVKAGDVAMVPAGLGQVVVEAGAESEWIKVSVPGGSSR